MKYLRTFNESMAREDVIDLMLELSDLGYKCSVDTKWSGDGEATAYGQDQWIPNKNYIQLLIVGRYLDDPNVDVNRVLYDEILPTINRIAEFLKTEGYEMKDITISKIDGVGWEDVTLEKFNKLIEDGALTQGWHQQRFTFNKS